MEKIDRQMAQRVWQRVRASAEQEAARTNPAEQPQLQELIARQWVDAALCRRLTPHFRGNDRRLLEEISRQKQICTARLKGICAMQAGRHPQIPAPPVPRGTPEQLLRLCCDGTAHCAAQYERLSAAPRYGREYTAMAEQAHLHHRQLLGLLGKV